MAVRSAALTGCALLLALTTTACVAVEENPLDVNSPRSQQNVGSQSVGAQQASADFGDDPLNLAENGATLCYTQPDIGFQEFTVLVHNEALQTFTLDDVSLKDPDGLTLLSAEVSPANRDGHHKAHSDDGGGHGAHHPETAQAAPDAEPAEASEPADASEPVPAEPVPAEGYAVATHDYVNLVVAVALADGADAGTASGITVAYSTGGQELTGTHPLVVELNREGCV